MSNLVTFKTLDPEAPVVFTHVPKTGGSAITSGMAMTVGRDRIAGISTAKPDERRAFLQRCREAGKSYVYGHFHYCDAASVYDRANYIIALRHPLERILSLYFMMLRNGHDFAAQCAKDINGKGFLDFFEMYVTGRRQDNLICRYLCREADSQQAIEVLEGNYALAWDSDGASEAWETLHRTLTGKDPRRPRLRKRNAAPVAHSAGDLASGARPKDYSTFLPQSSMDLVADHNRQDIELVEWFGQRVPESLLEFWSRSVATIERHPDIEDYFLELTLPEIEARGGIADVFEEGRLVILKNYRLEFDFGALSKLAKSIERVGDRDLKKQLKKLTGPHFFDGEQPVERNGRRVFGDPVRQAVFDILCRGDRARFDRAAAALKTAHLEAQRLFDICFPDYEAYRIVPSVRLTRTLFENLHWDNHSIDEDFHQARLFANLDPRPRIWNLSHSFTRWVRDNYDRHDLGRFAGKDPNLMIGHITATVLGGTRNSWMDSQPRHRVAFDPGEVWLGESRHVSHQIVYGERAMVYMWFVSTQSMANPDNRFNARVEQIHREMQARKSAAA